MKRNKENDQKGTSQVNIQALRWAPQLCLTLRELSLLAAVKVDGTLASLPVTVNTPVIARVIEGTSTSFSACEVVSRCRRRTNRDGTKRRFIKAVFADDIAQVQDRWTEPEDQI